MQVQASFTLANARACSFGLNYKMPNWTIWAGKDSWVGHYSIPIFFWISSKGTPFVSGMIRTTHRSWPTIQRA